MHDIVQKTIDVVSILEWFKLLDHWIIKTEITRF